MAQTDYSHFFQNLNRLQIEPNYGNKDQSSVQQPGQQKKDVNRQKCNTYFSKHQLAFQLKKHLTPKNSTQHTIADLIIDKYFTYSLNSHYEKISIMPKKLFVCGYCKEPFFRPSEYLKHCYIEKCPVNHQRSTFFFHFKNSSIQFKSNHLISILDKEQFKKIINLPYSHNKLFFSQYDEKNSRDSQNLSQCLKCGIKLSQCRKIPFISHCILACFQITQFHQEKRFQVMQNKQILQDFVNDILIFHENINILTLFDKSYLKLQITSSQKQNNPFEIEQKSNFLQKDKIFQYLRKKSDKCLDSVKLVGLPFYKTNQKFYGGLLPKYFENQRCKQLMPLLKLNTRLNKKYEVLSQYLQKSYFCGVCLKFFSSINQYLSHCIIYLCPINYEKNSHIFQDQKSQKQLNIQNVSIHVLRNQIQKIILDKRFPNIQSIEIKRKYDFPRNSWRYKCGKCGKKFQSSILEKNHFIFHVLKICQSQNHQLTTHSFKVKINQIAYKEYEKIIINYFYAMKIAQSSFGYKFVLMKNEKVNFEGDYFCGSCETSFQSKEEFVYHSITVCKSLESHESSHFIKKIYNPFASIQDPVANLVEQFYQVPLSLKNWLVQMPKPQNKPSKIIDKMQIQEEPRYSINQHVAYHQKDLQRDYDNKHKKEQMIEVQQKQEVLSEVNAQNSSMFSSKQKEQILNQTQNNQQQSFFYPKFQQEKIENNKQHLIQHQGTKFLRYNVDFMPSSDNLKFYCGKCRLNLKKETKFIEHLLQQNCRSFENQKSSHFYVTNNRMGKILENKVFSTRNDMTKITKFPQQFSIYQPLKSQRIICECKQTLKINKLTHHNTLKHGGQNLSSESYIQIRQNLYGSLKLPPIVMMTKIIGQYNFQDEFVCPCRPWGKFSYMDFVRHVLKRHQGKTPKFYMRLPET